MAETKDPKLLKLQAWKQESEDLRKTYDNRCAKNLKLLKGIFQDGDNIKSKVRDRNRTFFRKIWGMKWRLLASFYNAFLRDQDQFRIEGRDTFDDPRKAKVLQIMTEYRRDRMMREDSLFVKLIWALENIFDYGFTACKLRWDYNDKRGIDRPSFMTYPNEQVFPDMSAQTKNEMRFIHFLNYMTAEEIEELGFSAEGLEAVSVDSNVLRQARYNTSTDPIQNVSDRTKYAFPMGGEYPKPGSVNDNNKDANIRRYRIFESFWIEDGKVMYGLSDNFNQWLKGKEKENPVQSYYGTVNNNPYCNIILGTCLTEANKLMGEGFPEPLEGPQESYNYFLNMRKDNIALSMTGHTFVSRYGNVDIQSLSNRRSSGITMMDDVSAVRHEVMPDVTQSAYMEARMDEEMMEEMSGITATKLGQADTSKATVAQINYNESNAKIDLFIAIVGETLFRDFYTSLAYMIQRFETDETIYRIANEKLREETGLDPVYDVYDLGFEADVIVNVGLGTVSRDMELKQTMLMMDRAVMANRETANMLQMGVLKPEDAVVFNVSRLMSDMMPKLGKKNLKDYMIQLQQPPMMEAGGQSPETSGRMTPQIGNTELPASTEMMQAGSMGGV